MSLQKNLMAQLTYTEGASPNSRGNYGVTNVARTTAVPNGSWDVTLAYGYDPDADLPSVQVLGATAGFAQADAVAGDPTKIRIRTFDDAGALADRPWQFSNERNTLLTSTQDL